VQSPRAPENSLRVFEIARADSGVDLGTLVVDLPVAWARRHRSVEVVFMNGSSPLGWHAHVTDPDGDVLLSFPWTDHVDRILAKADPVELPVSVSEEGWDDLDQGWWGRVLLVGNDVYVAETDLDALLDVASPNRLDNPAPGVVLVDGVEVRWNVVGRQSWDEAWKQAVEACRRGGPTPVGEWEGEPGSRIVIRGSM
jgi:hypothetical protein